MKSNLLILFLLTSFFSTAQILTYDFVGLAGNEATANSNFNDPNLGVSTISRGTGLTASNNGDRFNATNWALTSIANAVTGNKYMEFTITPNAGYQFDVSSIVIQLQRSATGSSAIAIRNSLDGYAANLDTQYSIVDNTLTQTFTFTFSQASSTTAVTYRIYMYAEAVGGSCGPGDGAGNDIIVNGIVSSTGPCSTPTSQASTVISSNTTTTGVNLAWTSGATASGSIVVIRPTSTGNVLPVSGTNYIPNIDWTTAGQINANNRVFYRSNGSSITGITGLTAGTQYTVTVYAYNGSGTNICYNTTNPESFTFYTLALEPTSFGTGFSGCTATSTTSITVTFAAASTIVNATGYLLLYREGAAPTGVPVDGVSYTAGSLIGDSTVDSIIAVGAITRTVSGLNGGSTYYFLLIPIGSTVSTATFNYRTVATIPSTNCNTSPAPEINVKGVIGSNPSISDGDTTPQGTDNTLFATVVVGFNQAKNFRIENTGNANLIVSSITMVGGNNTEFVVSGITLPTSIVGGTFLDFTVTFTPTAAGVRNTTLTIANGDSNEASYDFLIQGTGTITASVDANVKGNGQSIPDNSIYPIGTNFTAFGVATVGVTTVVRTFTIENLGSTTLSLTGTPYVTITGPHAAMFTVTVQPSSGTIAASGSLTFDITFNPTSLGAKNATVVIANNDTDENPYNFNISGTAKGTNNIYVYGNGNDVLKGATTTALTNLTNFGSQAVPSGVKQNTFIITNLFGASVYLSSATISGADAAMFSIISQPNNGTFGDGNSTSLTINFNPTTVGVKNATVSFNVYSNSARTIPLPIDPVFTFAISGNGIVYTVCANGAIQTIAQQDFEVAPASPVWAYTSATDGTVNIAGGTYNNGSVAKNAFIDARSFQFRSDVTGTTRTASITLNTIDVSDYNNINLTFKTAAFRTTGTTQGADINELVQVETSIDGGVNWSTESVLRGFINSRWDFAATGVFDAYYTGNNTGATIDTRNGNAELANGPATYNVKNLPASANLQIRITLQSDRIDELWAIDNIKIEGRIPVSTIWDGVNWSAGYPTTSTKAIFDGDYDTSVDLPGNIEACECQIKTGRTVDVATGDYLEIQSNIYNNGILNIADNGSLVQINDDATNTGTNFNYQRIASIRLSDYVYWSSPVDGFNISNLSTPIANGPTYLWDGDAPNPNAGQGYWLNAAGNTMTAGQGYIVRGPNTFNDTTAQDLTATFTGKQNNGIITPSIVRGSDTNTATHYGTNGIEVTNLSDNFNLVGNPYPSSISAVAFLAANANIEGAVRLWSHGTLPASIANPFYASYVYNYTPNDYVSCNASGVVTGPAAFNGYIAAGQGFFVLMNDGAADTSQTVTFNNLMRSKTYDNTNFFKNSDTTDDLEKHRIWLDIVNSDNQSVRTLVGYIEGATIEKDRLYDAYASGGTNQNIYSIVNTEKVCIQGRPVPFDVNDTVDLGIQISSAGNYSIAIAAVDGLFEADQDIYIEDKLLNTIQNLKVAPYNFSSEIGTFDDRFVLRYTDTTLGNSNFESNLNDVIIASNNNQITVKSSNEKINSVIVYDILGREILKSVSVNNNEITLKNLNIKNQTLIVKTKLENGEIISRKIIM